MINDDIMNGLAILITSGNSIALSEFSRLACLLACGDELKRK